jgi:hypothetical protein
VPTEADHISQARENFDLALRLDRSSVVGRQWACTVLLYSAVHAIKAACSSGTPWIRPRTSAREGTHDWDEAWMKENAPGLYQEYRRLRTMSRRCRYQLADPGDQDVAGRERDASRILEPATAHILPTISTPPP